jgi:hypothetical protein
MPSRHDPETKWLQSCSPTGKAIAMSAGPRAQIVEGTTAMRETKVTSFFVRGLLCIQMGLVLFAFAAAAARQPQLWDAFQSAETIVVAQGMASVFQ